MVISSGIDKVTVFELPSGIWGDGGGFSEPRMCLVKWRSSLENRFHQIYVNGEYAGTTVDDEQRQMIVYLPVSLETAVRIEVFAVDAEDIYVDFSNEFSWSGSGMGRAKLSLLRDQDLPVGAQAHIYFDDGTGEINYDNPLTEKVIWLLAAWQDKAGFGMSGFGLSDFGFDSAAAVGLGRGSFGRGPFGLDADVIEWISPPLPAGVYKFGVKVIDAVGNESTSSETGQVTVIPAARPGEQMSISSFDKQANQLVLNIS